MAETKIQAAPLRQVLVHPSETQSVVILEFRTDHGSNFYAMTKQALEQVSDQLRKTADGMPDASQPSNGNPGP